ncbi:MAG: hypothetical protein IKH51_03825 [Clostridia bacterium]|nr:hypothetical protein [Clostridia bacterium]
MKKLLCILLASLMLTLCACQSGKNIITVYSEAGKIPTYICRLYPAERDDTRIALLLRRYDESTSSVAVAAAPGEEMTEVYSLPAGSLTYEMTAGDGLIAFFELTTYSDGSVNYALKVIDTKNNNKVHTPYKKTVSEDNDIQTRFIVIFDGCVYYLTKSLLLGRCRVMKYSVSDKELTEYKNYDFTENELTGGSSCTFISENSGYLTCGVVDGNRTTLKTYDLHTGDLVREKPLPYGAALVYMADHDYNTGMYAMYYISAQSDERVAVFAYSEDGLHDIMKFDDKIYVTREEVRLINDEVYFGAQSISESDDTPYKQFEGIIMNAVKTDADKKVCPGCLELFIMNGEYYGLCFDEKQAYEKMVLTKID